MAGHEVQDFLKGALGKLETSGRAADATPLKKWIAGAPPAKGVR